YFINNIPVAAAGTSFTIVFSDLPANTQAFTIKNAPTATTATNSDVNPASGRTDAFTLTPGQIRLDIDAGIITDAGGPLPVSLTQLKGVYNNGASSLTWGTQFEQNFSHFDVEFASDAVNFTSIGKVFGAGNSNSALNYSFVHRLPKAGVNYYRLKMVDKDGRFIYSNVVALQVTVKGISITGVYPNPFVSTVHLSVVSEKAETVRVRMFDNTGKLVYQNNTVAQRGTQIIAINDLDRLAAGTYTIEVNTASTKFIQQLKK
ncbi:MAG: T9SS type A sorting domain-containing protein, partial [Ferruginibacter sp.]